MDSQPIVHKALSRGTIRKSACILADITIRKSQPDSTAHPTPTTVDVQPGAAGQIKLLLIRSTRYGNNLKYKVHNDNTPERVLNDAVFLVGAGSLDLLEDANAPLDKLLVTNTTGQDVVLEIIVGRSAT